MDRPDSNQAGLLVSDTGPHRNLPSGNMRLAEVCRRRVYLGKYSGGNIKQGEELFIPGKREKIHQERSCCVGMVGRMNLSAGEVPDQPGVDRSKEALPTVRFCPQTLHMVQKPPDFWRGIIRGQHQADFGSNSFTMPLPLRNQSVRP